MAGAAADATRIRWLLTAAWASTLIPLGLFIYLTIEIYNLRVQSEAANKALQSVSEQTAALQGTKALLEADIERLGAELKEKEASNAHYRKLAGIRVRYYRASDEGRAERVAMTLGLDSAELAQSRLVGIDPNALAYGSEISKSDLTEIALAFLREGFPLRKLTPAMAVRDAKLIQVIASADAAQNCKPLSEAEIRAGVLCGGTTPPSP